MRFNSGVKILRRFEWMQWNPLKDLKILLRATSLVLKSQITGPRSKLTAIVIKAYCPQIGAHPPVWANHRPISLMVVMYRCITYIPFKLILFYHMIMWFLGILRVIYAFYQMDPTKWTMIIWRSKFPIRPKEFLSYNMTHNVKIFHYEHRSWFLFK